MEYNFSYVDGIIFDSTEENVYSPILGVAVYFQKMPKIKHKENVSSYCYQSHCND